MDRTWAPKLFLWNCFPLNTRTEYKHNTWEYSTSINRFSSSSWFTNIFLTWISFLERNKRSYFLPKSIRYFPRLEFCHIQKEKEYNTQVFYSFFMIIQYYLWISSYFIKVRSLRKEPSNHSISMFIGSSLPRFIRFSKVYWYVEFFCNLLMSCMFCSIVPSSTLHRSERKRWINSNCRLRGIVSRLSWYPLHKEESTLSLKFCTEGRVGSSYWKNRISFKMTKFISYFTKGMINFSLRYIYSVWYLLRFFHTSSCFLLSSLVRSEEILLESEWFSIWSSFTKFFSFFRIDKLVDTFMRDMHRYIIWVQKLEISCNNIWTPTEFEMFYDMREDFWSFERSSPVYFFPSFFTLGLCCIWKIVVVFFFLFFQSVEITRQKCRITSNLTGNSWRTSSDCICYLFFIFSFKKQKVDIFSFFWRKMSILVHGSNV